MKCSKCGQEIVKKIKPKWWHMPLVFIITLGVIAGMIWLVEVWKPNSIYEPRCWLVEDEYGFDEETGQEAVKQFPIKCKRFLQESIELP